MMYIIRKTFNPEIFQGKYKKKNYFEGWYYKIIDKKMENVFAIIPGICLDKDKKDKHAFLQVLDANKCKVSYIRYDIKSFNFNENKFEVEIADNYFSDNEIRLNIENEDISLHGELSFENIVKYPKSISKPSIMGPFAFVPFMECYHSIINIHQEVLGEMIISGNKVDFSNGFGYIEKDWGRSFPESWIWLQSNHFDKDDVSLMFSTAKIPWLGRSFLGFISFIRIKEVIYLFSTYSRAKIISLCYSDNILKVILKDKRFMMKITAKLSNGGILKAPKNGLMNREILESITAVVKVKLTDIHGEILYEGEGKNTGLEIVSEIFKCYKGKGD